MNVLNMPGNAEENSTAVATTPVRHVLHVRHVPDVGLTSDPKPRPNASR